MTTLLSVQNLACFNNTNKAIVSGISFDLQEGDILVLRGRSGSGKSTLLKCIAYLNVYQGELFFQGKTPVEYGISSYRTRVMYIPQRPSMLPGTPREFLETVLNFKSRSKLQLHQSASDGPVEISEQWGIPEEEWDRAWSSLSGGEAQRIVLALGLGLPGVEVLLLDEPTSALDEETSIAVEHDLVKLLNSSSSLKAIIWITHSHEQEERVATRHLSLEVGGTLSRTLDV